MSPSRTIVCPACGEECLLRREPVYEGFKKLGERLSCTACGHEFASEDEVRFATKASLSLFSEDEVPRKPDIFSDDEAPRRPDIFSKEEGPRKLDIFSKDEKGHTCRLCKHYVVNPFTQRCALRDCEVQATDTCKDFAPGEKAEDAD